MFRHYYMSLLHESIAKGAGKDIRDGAVVPFEPVWMFSVHYLIVLLISTVTFYAGVKIFTAASRQHSATTFVCGRSLQWFPGI